MEYDANRSPKQCHRRLLPTELITSGVAVHFSSMTPRKQIWIPISSRLDEATTSNTATSGIHTQYIIITIRVPYHTQLNVGGVLLINK